VPSLDRLAHDPPTAKAHNARKAIVQVAPGAKANLAWHSDRISLDRLCPTTPATEQFWRESTHQANLSQICHEIAS